jgi:hypothetical protein
VDITDLLLRGDTWLLLKMLLLLPVLCRGLVALLRRLLASSVLAATMFMARSYAATAAALLALLGEGSKLLLGLLLLLLLLRLHPGSVLVRVKARLGRAVALLPLPCLRCWLGMPSLMQSPLALF